MAYLLDGLPVEALGRMRSDRVMRRPAPSREEFYRADPRGGHPPKHGGEFRFAKPDSWGDPDAATVQGTDRYGTAQAMAWDRIRPRVTTRNARIDHDGELPVPEGTLIRLQVDHLPGGQDALPIWRWSSKTGMKATDIDLAMADVPPQIRPRTHLPHDQADARLDPAEAPHSRGRGPLDLARHHRPQRSKNKLSRCAGCGARPAPSICPGSKSGER